MVGRVRIAVTALLLAPVLAACSSDKPAAQTTTAPTPITRLDVSAVRLARAKFCDRLPDAAVRQALDGAAESDESWGNGDPLPGADGSGDVGHEIGCAWTGANGAVARAWVFARPVDASLAGTLVGQAAHRKGCTAERTAIFGSPALLQTCTLTGGVQRVRRAGLFGDAWLTCEVTGAASASFRARTDRWCASVVAALDLSGR
jgi:hypothetical protein